jgi:exopolyphosphatase / guanosine-5'-triphosphate,3'-diphosphate pyrophosphatase
VKVGEPKRLAAIDIGTVTTRLLVADVSDSGIVEVERSTDITHLGEGLTRSKRLSAVAMDRVADVVGRYAMRVRDLGVEKVVAVATSASRDAENGLEFSALLASRGIVPEIIRGDREAELAFAGAASDFDAEEGLLVADLGGGSTELVLGDVETVDGRRVATVTTARSIDVGSKRVTEMFLRSDPPTARGLAEAREWTVQQLRPFFAGLRCKPRILVAVAGTATTLSAIQMGLTRYDPAKVHMSSLSGSDLVDLGERLGSMRLAERKRVPGLDPGRAPVIVAGALILETVLALAGLDCASVGEHDILYGILLDAYANPSGGAAGTVR